MNLVDKNIANVRQLCEKYKVKSLYLFGSILTPKFNDSSDIDFLVKFKDSEIKLLDFGDNFFGFQFALEDLFNRRVDLVCDDVISNNYFRKEVDRTKRIIYGFA